MLIALEGPMIEDAESSTVAVRLAQDSAADARGSI